MVKNERSKLVDSVAETALTLLDQWSQTIETTVGKVRQYDSAAVGVKMVVISWPPHSSDQMVAFRLTGNRCTTTDSARRLLEAERTLSAVALFLSSKDFVDKIKGSIRRLKAVQRALM